MPPKKRYKSQRWIRYRESGGITYAARDDGRSLATARRAAGLSQEALAAKVGCNKSHIGHIELDGGRVYRSLAESIAAALGDGVTLADLFDVPDGVE